MPGHNGGFNPFRDKNGRFSSGGGSSKAARTLGIVGGWPTGPRTGRASGSVGSTSGRGYTPKSTARTMIGAGGKARPAASSKNFNGYGVGGEVAKPGKPGRAYRSAKPKR